MKLILCAAIAIVLVPAVSAGKTNHPLSSKDIQDAWTQLVSPLSCEETCLKTCCRDGGGQDCIDACGCKGKSCDSLKSPQSCEETCLKTCCRDGGGQDCVDACGCKGKSCPPKADVNAFIKLMASWKPRANGGCSKPGACGIGYQGCCFGAGRSGDACKCKLTDGSGNVGSGCTGTDKAGACGDAYIACCLGYKAKGNPCTCDVEEA